jgi:hypothetical protein
VCVPSSAPTCASPPTTLPTGFTPPTGVIGTGCTAADVQAYSQCEVTAAANTAPYCETWFTQGAPDGTFNDCGQCALGTVVAPGVNPPALLGWDLVVAIQPSLGDTAGEYDLGFGPEIGVCVYSAGGEPAHSCGLDLMALDACSAEICATYCAIPSPGDAGILDSAAVNALDGCLDIVSAPGGACGRYATASNADCMPFTNTQGTGVYDKCGRLIEQFSNVGGMELIPDAGPATAQGVAQLLELACGGGDAGF